MLAVENDCSSTVWFGKRVSCLAKKVDLRLGLGSVRIRPVCLTPHLHIDTQSTRLALIVGSGTQSRHLWTVSKWFRITFIALTRVHKVKVS